MNRFVEHLVTDPDPGHAPAVLSLAEDLPDELRVVLARKISEESRLVRLLLACKPLKDLLQERYQQLRLR